jgi:hypothetical protein
LTTIICYINFNHNIVFNFVWGLLHLIPTTRATALFFVLF